jgi:hypothetical protein
MVECYEGERTGEYLCNAEGDNLFDTYEEANSLEWRANELTWEQSKQRYEAMRKNGGEPAHQITRERFWDMLEVLPPEKWERRDGTESFMISEAQTNDLHSFYARVRETYWEMILPRNSSHADVMDCVEFSIKKELENVTT